MTAVAALLPFPSLPIGLALANHLWQSTVFAAAAGGVTLVLRKNRAQVRYWVWLIASLKFLLPFSLLIAAGTNLHWSRRPVVQQSQASMVIEQISQPFTAVAPAQPAQLPTAEPPAKLSRWLTTVLIAIWLVGSLAVFVFWFLRWRRVVSAIQGIAATVSGRELEILHRLERSAGLKRPLRLVLSPSAFEPGIIGAFRPVLLLPGGVPDQLTDAELAAVITHELCHVRRRDNLTAALHMLVEALFWFHPFVWWIGARLVDERERACDEEVLALGSEPQAYAEGILKICKFYLESPLACVAGVTGSNLKKRIEAIMIHRIARKLELGKKLLLSTLAVAGLIAPVLFGLFHPAQSVAQQAQAGVITPGFESVSIQPNTTGKAMPPFKIVAGPNEKFVGFKFSNSEFLATHATLPQIIRMAYGVLDFQVAGGSDWLNREKYDVAAKFLNGMEDAKFWSLPQDEQTSRMDQRRLELQALLADRFKLVVHRETRQLPIYALTIAPNGPKLHEATAGYMYPNGFKLKNGVPMGAGLWVPQQGVLLGQGVSMAMLAAHLSPQLGRFVANNTGLTGKYDFKLQWAPGKDESASLLASIPDQIGLQLTPQTGPVEMIVIDRAEPAETVVASNRLLKPVSSQTSSPDATAPSSSSIDVSITPKGPATGIVRSRISAMNGEAELSNVSLHDLIKFAYHLDDSQIAGGPAWLTSELYDVSASFPKHGPPFSLELQKALADKFHLATHRELRRLPVYELALGPNGAKITDVQFTKGLRRTTINNPSGHFEVNAGDAAEITRLFQQQIDRPVIDKTGLKGHYNFTLVVNDWTQPAKTPEDAAPFLRAVSEQLGLELKPASDLLEVLVVDHAEPVTKQQKETLATN